LGESENTCLKLHFEGHLRVEFRGAKVTSDAGLLAVRELDDALGLSETKLRRKSRHEVSNAVKRGTKERRIGVSGEVYGEILDEEYRFI